MPEVDPVILQLRADVAKYNADVAGAQRLTDQKLSAIEAKGFAMGQSVKKGFDLAKGAAIAYAATLGVGAVIRAASAGLEHAASLGEEAKQLGVTTDALQEYRYAATQVGLSSEEMDQALSQLTRRIGEAASGTKAQAEAFASLGVSVKDANGNIIDAGDAIPLIADALAKIESPAQRAAVLMDLFGRAGQKLEPLLAGGASAVNNLRDAAHRLGVVLSLDLINRADEAADKLAAFKTVIEARIAGAVAENVGSIMKLVDALGALIDFLGRADAALSRFQLVNKLVTARQKQSSFLPGVRRQGRREQGEAQEALLNDTLNRAGLSLDRVTRDLPGARKKTPGAGPLPSTNSGTTGRAAPAGPSGPTAKEIEQHYEDELRQITGRILSALEQAATTADERAEIQLRQLEFDRIAANAEIAADKDYSAAQKKDLIAANERLADREREAVERERQIALAREASDLAQTENDAQTVALRLQFDLADTQAERKRIALEMLSLEERYQASLLEAVLASETATEAEKERARVALESLASTAAAKRESVSRGNETEVERYLRDLRKTPEQINEAIDGIKIDGLEALNDGLVDAITGAKSLGDAFKDVANSIIRDLLRIAIQQAIIRPLAESLFGGGSGGGLFGLFGGASPTTGGYGGNAGSPFGGARASGGPVSGGRLYRVNEGGSPGRVEGFIPQGSGKIIPLGQMNAIRGGQQGGGTVRIMIEEAPGFAATVRTEAVGVAIEVQRQSAPALIDASAREALARAGRPRL